jgi:thiol-disulfide isomerase/thioredoxin
MDGFTQQQFILNGKVNGRDTGYIILRYTDYSGKFIQDTTYLQNSRFSFEGKIKEPTFASMKGYRKIIDFNEVNYTNFFIEPGTQKISLTENDYDHYVFEGSKTQREYDTLKMHFDSIIAKYKQPNQELLKAKYAYEVAKTEEEKNAALDKESEITVRLEPLGDEMIHQDIIFATTHPDSYVSPFIIYTPMNTLPLDSAEMLFNQLTPRVRNSWNGKYYPDMIRKKKQNSVGNEAYNFTATNEKGNTVSLHDFSGKYVLLDFWASWCKPCRAAIPHLKELYNQYHSKGFDIISVSIDEDSSAWVNAIRQENINIWTNVLTNKDINNNYQNTSEPIPSQILVGPDSKVVWTWKSEESMNDVLKRLMK